MDFLVWDMRFRMQLLGLFLGFFLWRCVARSILHQLLERFHFQQLAVQMEDRAGSQIHERI